MKSYNDYLIEEASKDRGSSKVKAMQDLVDNLKKILDNYDIATRRFVWDRLTSTKGEELMDKILRNPRTYLSDSEFTKLVEKK